MSGALETSLSIRWIIPFIRVTGASPADVAELTRNGVGLREFTDPDTRISHRLSMELLAVAIARTNDPEIGLKAGEHVEAGDYDALEYAARSCATVREAVQCIIRYQFLTHAGNEAHLLESGSQATWRWRPIDGVEQLPAANDFSLVSACSLARRYMGRPGKLLEVHFLHAQPTNLAEYERLFGKAEFKYSMPFNALVFDRALLDVPMAHAHPGMQEAYESHMREALQRVQRDTSIAGRVRAVITELLRSGDFDMERVAKRMAMSVSTLRRRLASEGTSHRDILDDLRSELAKSYLADAKLSIREVAFLLGFAHVTAFYKAYQRWSGGQTPAEYRATLKRRTIPGVPAEP